MTDPSLLALPGLYRPRRRNIERGRLPDWTQGMLDSADAYSAFFVGMDARRKAYFEASVFQPVVDTCEDDRLRYMRQAFGECNAPADGSFIPPGVIEVHNTPGSRTSFRSLATCLLMHKRFKTLAHAHRLEMRLSLAHHSPKHPKTASCAAWSHDTGRAVAYVRDLAAKLNHIHPGQRVAVHGLFDTDNHSVRLYGPEGLVDTLPISEKAKRNDSGLHQRITDRLRATFPRAWGPLARLDDVAADSFHLELGALLTNNVAFVLQHVGNEKGFQLHEHGGLGICVGRCFESPFVTEHGKAFIIDDHNPELGPGVEIALKYCSRNCFLAAGEARDWVIPIHINIPYSDDDLPLIWEYALETRRRIKEIARKKEAAVTRFLLESEHGVPKSKQALLRRKLRHASISERVFASVSVCDRATRRFELE